MNHWAIQWRSENKLDGKREFFMGRYTSRMVPIPEEFAGCPIVLFETRRQAQKFIDDNYGYIREREDLRTEPHGWKMPIPVRVKVTIEPYHGSRSGTSV
jgi:hypothetical protein